MRRWRGGGPGRNPPRIRSIRALRALAVVTIVALGTPAAALPAGAATDRPDADFQVGAAAADITPPLAAAGGADPAHCAAPPTYTGRHLLTLEEPYQDVNGN